MTARELARRLGQTALLDIERNLRVEVQILDGKTAYGCERYLVAPVRGAGQVWVDAGRLEFEQCPA